MRAVGVVDAASKLGWVGARAMNCKRNDIYFLLTVVFMAIFIVTFGVVNLLKYDILSTTTFGWQYPYAFYQLFHGKTIFDLGSDHAVLFFGAAPFTFVEALLYQCAPRVETLLIFQTVMLGLGAVPAYLLARKVTADRFLAFAFSFAYLTHPVVTSGAVLGFIPPSIALFFLLWALYFLEKCNGKAFVFFILLANAVKIDMVIASMMLGMALSLSKQRREIGLLIFRISLIWLICFMTVYGAYLVMNGRHFPVAMAHLEAYGSSLHQVGQYVVMHPLSLLKNMQHSENLLWEIFTGFPYFFIFFAPVVLLACVPEAVFILLRNHHSSGHFILYALVFWGTACGCHRVLLWVEEFAVQWHWNFINRRIVGLLLGVIIIAYAALAHYRTGFLFDFGPRMGAMPFTHNFSWELYHETRHVRVGKAMIAKIPERVRCMTFQSLAIHFKKCSLLGIFNQEFLQDQQEWDYIFLDLTSKDLYQISKPLFLDSLDAYLAQGKYGVVDFNDGWLLLKLHYFLEKNEQVRRIIHEIQI